MSTTDLEKFIEELREDAAEVVPEIGLDIEAAADMLATVLRSDNDPNRPTLHYVRWQLDDLAAKAMGNSTQGSDADESQENA